MNELDGKKALITGGSRGIGASIALALAERGADVVITYHQSADRASEVVAAIRAKGRRGAAIQADSSDSAAVVRSVDAAAEALGGLDILVNNVGTARLGKFVELSLADIDTILNTNVRATVLASQAAIPHIGQGGRIITIGSNSAERAAFSGLAVYALSKSALIGLTRHLARELGPAGITVNLVQPGPVDTELNPDNGSDLAELNRRLTALGRYASPAEIADLTAFIASPAASYMTGSVVTLDGGYNA